MKKKKKIVKKETTTTTVKTFVVFEHFLKKKLGQKILKLSSRLLANLTLNLKYISGLNNKRCMWQDLLFSYLFFVKFWLFFKADGC